MKSLIPDLSIIICTHNTKNKAKQCLDSLYKNTDGLNFEVIVSDNDSQDGMLELIHEEYPQVKVIKNEENLGFAKAVNKGIKMSKGRNILLLNSDTVVLPLALNRVVEFMDNHSQVGIVGANLLNPDGSSQRTNRQFPTPMAAFFGRKTLLTRLLPNNRFSQAYLMTDRQGSLEPYEVDWVSGACLMVKREVVKEAGMLDEGFFLYWEDADWCYRIKQRGWKVYCIPQAKVIHDEGSSVKERYKNRLIIEFHKSVYRYYRKHYLKSFFHPLNFLALIGLSLRAGTIVIWNFLKGLSNARSGLRES